MTDSRILAARPRTRLARWSLGLSARANYAWALHWPGSPPFIMLTEFPRSGGNWIRDMIADALQLPAPRFSRLPITFPAIVHNHDHRPLREGSSIYVIRDGRDVFLSHLDKTVTAYLTGTTHMKRRILKLHPSLASLSTGVSSPQIDQSMFYAEWIRRPLGSRVNWGDHVGQWLNNTNPELAKIRYEDMRARPEDTLTKALEILSDRPISPQTITFAIERNSFEAQTGRKPGQKDMRSTKRMGIAGAWKTEMQPQLQAQFTADFGAILERLGYEVG